MFYDGVLGDEDTAHGSTAGSALKKPVHILANRDSISVSALRPRALKLIEPRVARPDTTTTEAMADHGPRVLQTVWNLVSSTEEAQDVFQEAFLQHHLAVTRGRTIDNTAAWLCTTALHAAFRLRRRKCGPGRRVPEDLRADLGISEDAARACAQIYCSPNDRTFSLNAATTPGFASRSGFGTICALLPTEAPPKTMAFSISASVTFCCQAASA
jgi:hypothetical protein